MEIWKDIIGYEGIYQVSNLGRVKSLNYNRTGKEKIMNSCKGGCGYLQICLSKEGKKKNYLVHRLVTQAFLDNPNTLSEVNHKDENKTNNCVDNLEWCSPKYNMNYGSCIERTAKANSIPILQFSKEGNFIRKWESATQVRKESGFLQGNISMCCKGKRKSAYGYKWKYYYKGIWLKNHIPLKDRKVA